ncbi:hypothetical protein FLONG3_10651 [Fusarium longipes]|uniref:Uncharacterized protein n=1 Tax=Fusarium longipes TaxID=694270 RepID=A0A395RLW0_9HYPO|nr:hypothetical protein FLONG3_10651 [Fusarium longipes]
MLATNSDEPQYRHHSLCDASDVPITSGGWLYDSSTSQALYEPCLYNNPAIGSIGLLQRLTNDMRFYHTNANRPSASLGQQSQQYCYNVCTPVDCPAALDPQSVPGTAELDLSRHIYSFLNSCCHRTSSSRTAWTAASIDFQYPPKLENCRIYDASEALEVFNRIPEKASHFRRKPECIQAPQAWFMSFVSSLGAIVPVVLELEPKTCIVASLLIYLIRACHHDMGSAAAIPHPTITAISIGAVASNPSFVTTQN